MEIKPDEDRSAELPWEVDRFVSEDNSPDRDEPKDLEELRVRSPRYITALKDGAKPRIERFDDKNTWVLELGDDFMMGRPGREAKMLPRAEVEKNAYVRIKPNIPKWSGVTYHTKVSSPRNKHLLTRISGKKVTPHYIFGADNRQVYYPNGYPWRCIGKVESWYIAGTTWISYESGTGALVGDNVMVTASHLFPWFQEVIPGFGWAMKFTPAFYDGSSAYGSGVYSWCESGYGYSDHDQGDDMIVMKLYTPLGNSLGWMGARTYHDSWEGGHYWTKCGYPKAIASGNRPSRIMWFPIVDDDWDGAGLELEYKADSSGGDSGGPVFGWWDDGPDLVGVHSGGEEEYQFPWYIVKNNVAAGGSILPNLIIWARNNW